MYVYVYSDQRNFTIKVQGGEIQDGGHGNATSRFVSLYDLLPMPMDRLFHNAALTVILFTFFMFL